jgi:hypothetical protein
MISMLIKLNFPRKHFGRMNLKAKGADQMGQIENIIGFERICNPLGLHEKDSTFKKIGFENHELRSYNEKRYSPFGVD